MRTGLSLIATVMVTAIITACQRPGPEVAHETLSSIDLLRNAFNADSGKIRAIFLASPT